MKKMLVAIMLLAVIATLAFLEEGAIGRICDEMIMNVEKLKSTEGESLNELIEKTEKEWEKQRKVLEMLTPHENTDEIDINWCAYKSRIKAKNYTAARYELDEMSQRFKEMRGKIKVNTENIL